METTLYKITFSDGRMFKVFAQNKSQKVRFLLSLQRLSVQPITVEPIENGIHTISQWEEIVNDEYYRL